MQLRMARGLRMDSNLSTAKKLLSLRASVRYFPLHTSSSLIVFGRWSVVGLFPDAHACGSTPNVACPTTHSNILVDRSNIYFVLSTRVILQDEEQRYDDDISHYARDI